MKSFFSRGMLCVLFLLSFVLIFLLVLKFTIGGRVVRASVSPKEMALNDSLFYKDSTMGAEKVHWEFGDGEDSYQRSGFYQFAKEGKYQVRLTVDDALEAFFVVNVSKRKRGLIRRPIRIVAPKQVVQNERVVFMADGNANDWRWEFGLSGMLDSQDKNPIYSYSLPGCYEVRLLTENMEYPIVHSIEVLPEFADADSSDVFSLIASDIQEHLQRIIDKRTFNEDYNYVLKKYLGGNSEVIVLVNNEKENDFYSYCYGLNIMGRQRSTIINEVVIESLPDESGIKKLLVSQSSSKDNL